MKHAIALAQRVLIGLAANLPAGTARGERMEIRDNTRNPHIAKAGNAYLASPTSGNLAGLLLAMRQTPGVHVARADLFNRAVGVLTKHSVAPQLTLAEAAEKYQTQFRYRGRSIGRRLAQPSS